VAFRFDKRSVKILALCLVTAVLWIKTGGSASNKAIPDKECIECHSNKDLTGKNRDGKTVSVHMDVNVLKASVHKDTLCTQCHVDAAKLSETATKELPHIKNLPRVTCNLTCHREDGPAQYKDSIHGRLAAQLGDQDVAKCRDCHGGHDVVKCTDPTSDKPQCDPCQGCAKCHENQALIIKHNIHQQHPCLQWQLSAHGAPRMIDGKMRVAATCTDCHGVHSIQGVGAPVLSVRQPATCGKCHPKEMAEYLDSIHGKAAVKENNPDAPLCVDCHGEHNILAPGSPGSKVSPRNVPDTCAACHARPALMKKYGIAPDKLSTFINSFHGIALEFNQNAVATCASCHNNHLVLPASDSRSGVYPANLPKTCGKPACHPNMPESISKAKIHVDYYSPKSGAIYWVQKLLIWALILLIVVSFIWVIPDIIHRFKLRRLKKKGDVAQKL